MEKLNLFNPPFCRKPRCWSEGDCIFAQEAQNIAQRVVDIENPGKGKIRPEEAHRLIARKRIPARSDECPYLNEVNPDYPGKENL